jgi:hypothetical protein
VGFYDLVKRLIDAEHPALSDNRMGFQSAFEAFGRGASVLPPASITCDPCADGARRGRPVESTLRDGYFRHYHPVLLADCVDDRIG